VLERYLIVKRLEFPGSRGPAVELNHDDCPVFETAIESQNLQEILDAFEKQLLQKMLEQHHWKKTKTAQALGIGRKTLYRKMKQFGLL
jgi:DNA-binding NtrC family response regulator